MTITMNDDNIVSIAQIKEFAKLTKGTPFKSNNKKQAYVWIDNVLTKFNYFRIRKSERTTVKEYIRTMTGYSETQVDRLIAQKRTYGAICPTERTQNDFPSIYTVADIALLADVDNAEGRRNGNAVRKTFSDMYTIYNDERFVRLAGISVSHIYNLRKKRVYQTKSYTYTKTNPTAVAIGIRIKPNPNGMPGYLRIDSVHQGDLDKKKGVYHINLVDEVTQTEVVVTVEGISEYFLIPALESAMQQFPFAIINFHSDNGSEYINKSVARLLQKLLVAQTKSRSRKTNDQALVEGKNAAVVRKAFGFAHIPKKYAPLIDGFNREYFNPYIFYHRQCAFADNVIDHKGKIRKVYRVHQTPCQKLLSLPNVSVYLREGVTIETLTKEMMKETHFASAEKMRAAKDALFANIRKSMIE